MIVEKIGLAQQLRMLHEQLFQFRMLYEEAVEFGQLRTGDGRAELPGQFPMEEPTRPGGQLGRDLRMPGEEPGDCGMVAPERRILQEGGVLPQALLNGRMLLQELAEPAAPGPGPGTTAAACVPTGSLPAAACTKSAGHDQSATVARPSVRRVFRA